jgi:hypothetical protein
MKRQTLLVLVVIKTCLFLLLWLFVMLMLLMLLMLMLLTLLMLLMLLTLLTLRFPACFYMLVAAPSKCCISNLLTLRVLLVLIF